MTQAAETLTFIHQDHLGSTALVTDQGGNEVARQTYYPYGSKRSDLQLPTERQYTGQVSDQTQTGLYYYNARYYDSQIALFTQADILGGSNGYAYVGGNPVAFSDPSGLMEEGAGAPHNPDAIFPWDEPQYSFDVCGQGPMLCFLYQNPGFDIQNYMDILVSSGTDLFGIDTEFITSQFLWTQGLVQHELGMVDNPFGRGTMSVAAVDAGFDTMVGLSIAKGQGASLGFGALISRVAKKFQTQERPEQFVILDIGGGRKKGYYSFQDNAITVNINAKVRPHVQADATALPFKDNSAHSWLASNLPVEPLLKRGTWSEAVRVTKPGRPIFYRGLLIQGDSDLWISMKGLSGHLSRLGLTSVYHPYGPYYMVEGRPIRRAVVGGIVPE